MLVYQVAHPGLPCHWLLLPDVLSMAFPPCRSMLVQWKGYTADKMGKLLEK